MRRDGVTTCPVTVHPNQKFFAFALGGDGGNFADGRPQLPGHLRDVGHGGEFQEEVGRPGEQFVLEGENVRIAVGQAENLASQVVASGRIEENEVRAEISDDVRYVSRLDAGATDPYIDPESGEIVFCCVGKPRVPLIVKDVSDGRKCPAVDAQSAGQVGDFSLLSAEDFLCQSCLVHGRVFGAALLGAETVGVDNPVAGVPGGEFRPHLPSPFDGVGGKRDVDVRPPVFSQQQGSGVVSLVSGDKLPECVRCHNFMQKYVDSSIFD